MGRKRELTKMGMPRGSEPRWRKMYNGRLFYFRGSYEVAVKQWHAKQAELEGQGEEAEAVRVQAAVAAGLESVADRPEGWTPEVAIDRATTRRRRTAGTVQSVIDAYLAAKRTQADAGERSITRWDTLRCGLAAFSAWLGESSIDDVNGQTLTRYWSFLMGRIAAGEISQPCGRDWLAIVRQWVRWAWQNEYLAALPRNIDSRELSIRVQAKDVPTFTAEQIQTLLEKAPDRTKLYLLLALNCGFTQVDISDLRPEEVDWTAGTISRQRSKTKGQQNVPVVTYQLWPETLALLRKFQARDPERVLLNADGEAIRSVEVRDGKARKCDATHSAFSRLKAASGIGGQFKWLRKTAASLLNENRDYSRFVGYFLGHSPRSVADRHYARPAQAEFDEALNWLRGKVIGEKK